MLVLILVAFLAILATLFPMLAAHPLVEQTPAILSTAHWLLTWGPFLAIGFLLAGALQARRIWNQASTPRRLFAVLLVLPAIGLFFWSRQHFTEFFFAPATDSVFTTIQNYSDIQDSDLVLGVQVEGEYRAYPVRYMAFHHMLNDTIGSVALLPTY